MNIYCDKKNDIVMLSAIFSNTYALSIIKTSETSMSIIIDRKCKEIDARLCKMKELCEININNVEIPKTYLQSGIIKYIKCIQIYNLFKITIKFDTFKCELNTICRDHIDIYVNNIAIKVDSIDSKRISLY